MPPTGNGRWEIEGSRSFLLVLKRRQKGTKRSLMQILNKKPLVISGSHNYGCSSSLFSKAWTWQYYIVIKIIDYYGSLFFTDKPLF